MNFWITLALIPLGLIAVGVFAIIVGFIMWAVEDLKKKMDNLLSASRFEINKFRRQKMDSLSPEDRLAINQEAERIICRLKQLSPSVLMSIDQFLEAAFAALYFEKFHESPLQTAMTTSLPRGYNPEPAE